MVWLYNKQLQKQNFWKIETSLRWISREIFFRKKTDSLADVLLEKQTFTVFELNIIQTKKEFSKQLRFGASTQYNDV